MSAVGAETNFSTREETGIEWTITGITGIHPDPGYAILYDQLQRSAAGRGRRPQQARRDSRHRSRGQLLDRHSQRRRYHLLTTS
jgi:hypothetical protein